METGWTPDPIPAQISVKPLPLAVVVAEDMNRIVLAQPAVKLVEKFAALRLGNLRVGRAFAERTKGVERGKNWSAGFQFGRWSSSFSLPGTS